MDIYEGLDCFTPPAQGVALTIGNFDGVHRGHRRLVETARAAARELDAPVVAMTFEPHPLAILAPERAPARLSTPPEKLALLESLGVDAVIVVRSEPALFSREPEDFLANLVECCRPRAIVEGVTFSFGRGRTGSIETLRRCAAGMGYKLYEVETVRCAELPGNPEINSSAIRRALLEGRLEVANVKLGRAYRITGTVGGGDGRGAPLGFPTANLENIEQLLPQEAVYAAVAQLDNGEYYLAGVNIGPQPTFEQTVARVEAHLIGYDGDLRSRRVGLHLLARLRGQMKFASADELVAQLERDIAQSRNYDDALEEIRDALAIAI